MIRTNISALLFSAFLFIAAPAVSEAYTPYNHFAGSLTDTAALYSISVNLGHPTKDVYVPVLTQRTNILDTASKKVGFSFTTSEDVDTKAGTAHGLILSNAEIVDGMYKVPAGAGKVFTFVGLLTLDDNDPRAKYGLQITNFPFLIGEKQDGLNTHELGAYTTKEIGLNK